LRVEFQHFLYIEINGVRRVTSGIDEASYVFVTAVVEEATDGENRVLCGGYE
jgi:hypothetical protein